MNKNFFSIILSLPIFSEASACKFRPSDGIVKLTEKPQLLTWRFKPGIREIQQGAWAFQPVIFLLGTDSRLTVEKIDVKVIRR